MLIKKIIFLFVLTGGVLWSEVFSLQAPASEPAKKNSPQAAPSLIRMELLPQKEVGPPPVERDIFAPFSPPSLSTSAATSDSAQAAMSASRDLQETTAGEIPGWAGNNLSLRYIGYVHSSQKTIALILLNGLALTVEEGDYLDSGIKVGKITAEEIVLIGPDGESSRFSLEGDKNEKN